MLPSGPVDLTHLTWGSDDWYRLSDWCSASSGGASASPGLCAVLQNGVRGQPNVTVNLAELFPALLQVGLGSGEDALGVVLDFAGEEAPGGELIDDSDAAWTTAVEDLSKAVEVDTTTAVGEDVFAGSGLSWEGEAPANGSTTPAAVLPGDAAVAGRAAPDPLDVTGRPVGANDIQNATAQHDVGILAKNPLVTDLKVNQWQASVATEDDPSVLLGRNRPDLQFTFGGQRYYIEYDVPSSLRGPGHAARILANDPGAIVYTLTVPVP
jgi:hypothetical protein